MNRERRIAAAEAQMIINLRRALDEARANEPSMFEDGVISRELRALEQAVADYEREHAGTFTCPVCGRTSANPTDVAERWCNACHGATGYPPPPTMTWVLFVGGTLDGTGRLMPDSDVGEGYSYYLVNTGEDWRYTGHEFVLFRKDA